MKRRNPKAVDEAIDRNLKQAFDALAQEPVPDRLLQLLDRLRADEAEGADAEAPAVRDGSDGDKEQG